MNMQTLSCSLRPLLPLPVRGRLPDDLADLGAARVSAETLDMPLRGTKRLID
jgi:hypothetical protein